MRPSSLLSRLTSPLLRTMRGRIAAIVCILTLTPILSMIVAVNPAHAYYCCTCCNCCGSPDTQQIVDDDFQEYRDDWIVDTEYFQSVETVWKNWADRWKAMFIQKAAMIGGFYDAQAHSASMLALQKLSADAMNDYMPSEAVCQFGTLSRSLAASDSKARANQLLMSEITMARQLGMAGGSGAAGLGNDRNLRTTQFIRKFCVGVDDNNALTNTCAGGAIGSMADRDVDYTRALGQPETLNMDLTDGGLTNPEESLIALNSNLYGNSLLVKRLSDGQMRSESGKFAYNLIRSVDAKRAVAQNSFAALAGMKAKGPKASRPYMRQILTNLGMSTKEVDDFMASKTSEINPSYYAQMDILTKRIYQDPSFYVHLYDKPANIKRQTAAMEGLGMMQDRDIFHSMSRSEMLLAVLVELEAVKLQSRTENAMTGGNQE